MRNKFPLTKILILVTILAVPGFLYYLLQDKGKNRYKPLPFYGPKEVAETFTERRGKKIPDTIYHRIPDFSGVNQIGEKFDFDSVKNEIVIANFFYTNAEKLGDEMFRQISWLRDRYADNKMIRFVSVSIDPENDNGAVVQEFARQHKALAGKWDLVIADTSVVYPLASNGFYVNAFKHGNDYVLSEKLILLDKQHRIRGYYSCLLAEDMKSLNDEIKVLITEELRKMQ